MQAVCLGSSSVLTFFSSPLRSHPDDISNLDLRLGTSSPDCTLREASITQEMNPALRASTQNGRRSRDYVSLGIVPLVGGSGSPARCRLRGTFVNDRRYNFRDATSISLSSSPTPFGRPGTVAGQARQQRKSKPKNKQERRGQIEVCGNTRAARP